MQRTPLILACFFIFPIAIGSANCFAQQYPFVHYTPKDGLVNSRVRKAYQDSKGRMYFLTFGGLSVYDGARFKNYTTREGLASNLVNDVLEVGDDSLLVATNSGNYVNLLVNGVVKNLNIDKNCPVVNEFYRHEDNKIYLASDNGLYLLKNKSFHKLNVSNGKNYLSPINFRSITGIGNWLFISTNEMSDWQGVYLYDIKNNRIADSLNAYLIGKDRKNNIWTFYSNQLLIFDPETLEKGKLSLKPLPPNFKLSKNFSTTFISFDNKSAWFVYRNKDSQNLEISRIDETGDVFHMPLPARAMPTVIGHIFVDREKTVWLCNEGEGVFKIVNSPLRIFEDLVDKSVNGNINNAFYSLGTTWFYTNKNKLIRKKQDEVTSFTCNLTSPFQIFHFDGMKLFAFDYNKIYEGSVNERNKSIHFQNLISLPGNDYLGRGMLVDHSGNIITGSKSGLRVWKNKKPVLYIPSKVKIDIIDELFIDRNNLLWVQYRYYGIIVFSIHPESDSNYLREIFYFQPNQIIGSPRRLVIDKTGIVWIGTRENGVIGYKNEKGQLKKICQFDTGSGLTDNFVTTLACDSSNNIIVGTQTGLDRIIRSGDDSFRIENLTKSLNFFSLIYQVWADKYYAYARCYSGVILQAYPPIQNSPVTAPQLILEEIKVNAKSITTFRNDFKHTENSLNFHFAAPSFVDEKQITYSYLLKGSGNEHWNDTSAINSAINLTNLSPGKYSLQVKSFFPSGIYPPSEYSYSFEITPRWTQTWGFRSGIGLLGIGVLAIILRFYYKRRLEKQLVFLEKQQAIEKERTRIATDMHDDLGAGLSRIKFLSETIGIKKQQHQPIEEDISKIREYSHDMIDKMGEIVWALNEKNDSLSDLLSYTRSYAVEYLSQNGIGCTIEAPEQAASIFVSGEFRRNIYLVVKEALHNIVKHAHAQEVAVKFTVNERLTVTIQDNGTGFDKNNTRAFSNGLSNMENRIKEINGEFYIENKKGTTVTFSVPIQ